MKLHDSMFQTYGGFTLDADKIEMHSISKNNVELPYCGPMPEQFDGTSNARISFNVQPTQCNVLLKADKPNGKTIKAIVDAENGEIRNILNTFFFDDDKSNTGSTGLKPFWEGIWTAHFIDWKKIVLEHRDYNSIRGATA